MLPAIISDRSLCSLSVLRIAIVIVRKEISSRAAKIHQQEVRIWSQNLWFIDRMQRRTYECHNENRVDREERRHEHEPRDSPPCRNKPQDDSIRNNRKTKNQRQVH